MTTLKSKSLHPIEQGQKYQRSRIFKKHENRNQQTPGPEISESQMGQMIRMIQKDAEGPIIWAKIRCVQLENRNAETKLT